MYTIRFDKSGMYVCEYRGYVVEVSPRVTTLMRRYPTAKIRGSIMNRYTYLLLVVTILLVVVCL